MIFGVFDTDRVHTFLMYAGPVLAFILLVTRKYLRPYRALLGITWYPALYKGPTTWLLTLRWPGPVMASASDLKKPWYVEDKNTARKNEVGWLARFFRSEGEREFNSKLEDLKTTIRAELEPVLREEITASLRATIKREVEAEMSAAKPEADAEAPPAAGEPTVSQIRPVAA